MTTVVSIGSGSDSSSGSISISDSDSDSPPDYVDLRLNDADEVRVILTDGKQGRASLDRLASNNLKDESEKYDDDKEDFSEQAKVNGIVNTDQSQLYYPLRSADITDIQARARSDINVHQVSCHFTGSPNDRTYPWIRGSVSEDRLLNFYSRTNDDYSNDISDDKADNAPETRQNEALVSDVYCVLEEEDMLKLLIQTFLDSSTGGRGIDDENEEDNGRSILQIPIRLLPQEQFARPPSRRLYRYAMHKFTSSQYRSRYSRGTRRKKKTKAVRIERAGLIYEVGRTMICRTIEYEDGPESRLVQGKYHEGDKDIIKAEGKEVVAIYCDDALLPEEYVGSVMGTEWDSEWSGDGYPPYRELFEWY